MPNFIIRKCNKEEEEEGKWKKEGRKDPMWV
jgi:hypothetical protein